MKILNILASLAVLVPLIAFAQIDTASTIDTPVSTGATAPTTNIESEDTEVAGGGSGGSSSGNIEANEKGSVEKSNTVGISSSSDDLGASGEAFDDVSDDDGQDDDIEDTEFTSNSDQIKVSATSREGDSELTDESDDKKIQPNDDSLDDLGLRSDDDIDGDGLNDDKEGVGDDAHKKWIDVLSATWDTSIAGDSFFDVFVNFDDVETRAAVDAFLKFDSIDGESQNDKVKEDNDLDSSLSEKKTESKKTKEIVIVGNEARKEVQKAKVAVGGWDPEKKEVTIGPDDIEKAEDFLDLVGATVLSDENIEEVSLSFEKIKMNYPQPAKLFGFFNIDMMASAEVNEKGEVKMSFPWYRFLTTNNVGELRKEMDKATPKLSEAIAGGEPAVELLRERARLFQTISDVMKEARDMATR